VEGVLKADLRPLRIGCPLQIKTLAATSIS